MHAVGLRSGHYLATDMHATMDGTVVFYGIWSGTTMWKCFLWGPVPGYITEDTSLMYVPLDREKPFIENTRGLNLVAVRRTTVQVTDCFSEWLH
jgi:hypothetical protein